jgi:hypothetical protein
MLHYKIACGIIIRNPFSIKAKTRTTRIQGFSDPKALGALERIAKAGSDPINPSSNHL